MPWRSAQAPNSASAPGAPPLNRMPSSTVHRASSSRLRSCIRHGPATLPRRRIDRRFLPRLQDRPHAHGHRRRRRRPADPRRRAATATASTTIAAAPGSASAGARARRRARDVRPLGAAARSQPPSPRAARRPRALPHRQRTRKDRPADDRSIATPISNCCCAASSARRPASRRSRPRRNGAAARSSCARARRACRRRAGRSRPSSTRS